MDRATDIPAAGTRLGRYEIVSVVGEGGMGVVCRAYDHELRRPVAVKFIRGFLDGDLRDRFEREIQLTARLRHPNVVAVHDRGEHRGRPFLVMEWIDGESLSRARGRLDRRRIVELVAQAADGVAHAHAAGILHRDIKPDNLLVAPEGIKVADFGLARERAAPGGLTLSGSIMGTPGYMSPEQARGQISRLDERTDVYSLGATLYGALTGRAPFESGDPVEMMVSVAHFDPPTLRSIDPTLPADLETICQKAMEKEPARRYASAADFAADLRRWLAGEAIAARPRTIFYRVKLGYRRHRVAWTLGAALAATVLFGGAGWLVSRHQDLQRRLDAEQAEGRRARARQRVDAARATLEQVRTSLYVEGCTIDFEGLDRTKAACRAALEEDPRCAAARYVIGMAERAGGDFDAADEALRCAVELDPSMGHAWSERARLHMEMTMAAAEAAQPMAVEAFQREIAAADEAIRRAGEAGTTVERDVVRVFGHLARGDLPGAETEARRALAAHGRTPGVEELELAVAMILGGEEGLAHLDAAISIRPGYFVALMERGVERASMDDPDGALRDFDEAIRVNPRFIPAYKRRAVVRFNAGLLAGAVEDCDVWHRADPRDPAALMHRGVARTMLGDLLGGRDDLRRAREICAAGSAEAQETAAFLDWVEAVLAGPADPRPVPIERDVTTAGRLEPADAAYADGRRCDSYSFEGRAGETVEITAHSTDIELMVALHGPGGFAVGADITRAVTGRQYLGSRLPADGTYRIDVAPQGVEATGGDYRLTVRAPR